MSATKSASPPSADVVASLASLCNLGPKSAQALAKAGITLLEQLKELGSVAAYVKVKRVEPTASLNLLWALEGAISGLHWQVVAKEHRTSLLLALESHLRLNAAPQTRSGPRHQER
jgi:DNA transformation protein